LAIAALEDKIVQKAACAVLNVIYEEDFLGFSYGFRPKRSQHDALDALITGTPSGAPPAFKSLCFGWRGARSLGFPTGWPNAQAVVQKRASCQLSDLLVLFRRTTAPHIAAFILPSLGRVVVCSRSLASLYACDNLRQSTNGTQFDQRCLRRMIQRTNRQLASGIVVGGGVQRLHSARNSCACGSLAEALVDAPSKCSGFAGNNALDLSR